MTTANTTQTYNKNTLVCLHSVFDPITMTAPREFVIAFQITDEEMVRVQQQTPEIGQIFFNALDYSTDVIMRSQKWQCLQCREPATTIMNNPFFMPHHPATGCPAIFNATPWPLCNSLKCKGAQQETAQSTVKEIEAQYGFRRSERSATVNYVTPLVFDAVGHKVKDFMVRITLDPQQANDLSDPDSHAMELVKRLGAKDILKAEPWECFVCGRNGKHGVKATNLTDICIYVEHGFGGHRTIINHSAFPTCSDPDCIDTMNRENKRNEKRKVAPKCKSCRSEKANTRGKKRQSGKTLSSFPAEIIAAAKQSGSSKKKGKKKKGGSRRT